MNNFTKQELEAIIEAFDYIEDDPMWCSPIGCNDEMRAKVQSMIDNYLDMNDFTREEPIWLEDMSLPFTHWKPLEESK